MCLSTISIKTPKAGRISVPCGKCTECLQKRRSEWTFRLLEELKVCDSAHFITLTYDDENLPLDGNLSKKHCQDFIKRLRKEQNKKKGKQIRYYLVGEYGEHTERPHYHLILFNLKAKILTNLETVWQNGNIFVGGVSQASIHYVTKYMLSNQCTKKDTKPFSLMSRRPYLGYSYISEATKVHHRKAKHNQVTYPEGRQQAMPRVYKERIFSTLSRQVNAQEALQDRSELTEKLIAKYGEAEYLRRIGNAKRADYKQMLKQSKSKKV